MHASHDPAPAYVELHHVIPQAWQAAWAPPGPWPNQAPSPDRPGLLLWDARTIGICRTGHGNVHYYLVATMREAGRRSSPDTVVASVESRAAGTLRTAGTRIVTADLLIAHEAISRWVDAGGRLSFLTSRGLWGEI